MRFQCGTCDQYYLLENAEQISPRQMLRCIGCGNVFVFQKNLSFSSSSRNSKRICDGCVSLLDEAQGACPTCRQSSASVQEIDVIDNRDYAFFLVRKGRIRPKGRSSRKGRIALLVGAVLVVSVAAALVLLLPGGKRDAMKTALLKPLGITSRTETFVVILRSGTVIYAEKIEHQGTKLKITEKNGRVVILDEQEVASTAKATLEE